jgi:hypothetical protein
VRGKVRRVRWEERERRLRTVKEKNKEKRNVSTFLQANVKKTLPNGLTSRSFLRLG